MIISLFSIREFIHERARVSKFCDKQKGESGRVLEEFDLEEIMLQIDPTRVKEDVEDRLRVEEESVNWLRDKMKQSQELTSTMTGEIF